MYVMMIPSKLSPWEAHTYFNGVYLLKHFWKISAVALRKGGMTLSGTPLFVEGIVNL